MKTMTRLDFHAITARLKAALLAVHRRLVPEDPDIGWTAYLWLSYLVFFFLEWFFRPVGTLELLVSIPAAALFLVLYFLGFWVRGKANLAIAAAMTALGLATAPFNAGAMVFFVFAVAAVASEPDRRVALPAMALIMGILFASAPLLQPSPVYWAVGGMVALIVGASCLFYARRFREQLELELNHNEVRQLARMRERERIARDLHDQLGQSLSLVTLKAQLARALVRKNPERAEQELREMEEHSRQALERMREAVRGYRQADLATELASARLGLASMDIQFEYTSPPVDLPGQVDQEMALVLREAVTNVLRHSSATRCRADFQRRGDMLECCFQDNGRVRNLTEGNGLRGMRERLEALGGTMKISTDKGVQLIARLPIQQDRSTAMEETA